MKKQINKLIPLLAIAGILAFSPDRSDAQTTTFTESALTFTFTATAPGGSLTDAVPDGAFTSIGFDGTGDFSATFWDFNVGMTLIDGGLLVSGSDRIELGVANFAKHLSDGPKWTIPSAAFNAEDFTIGTHSFVLGTATLAHGGGSFDEFVATFEFTVAAGEEFSAWKYTLTGSHVPEPGTIILLGAGMLGLGLVKRIRQRRKGIPEPEDEA